MSKYIPPHARAASPSTAAAQPAQSAAGGGTLNDWLREARQGYTPKTPEQIRQECLCLNYTQLRSRAGPPPPVSSDDFGGVWEQGGEGEGARACCSFDEALRLYKLGRGGPPAPLLFDGRDDGNVVGDGVGPEIYLGPSAAQQKRADYRAWYEQWGARLTYLWRAENGLLTTTKKLPPVRRVVEEKKEPTRSQLAALAVEISDKSGW